MVRIETVRGPLAVRGWPIGGLPRRRIEELHRLLEHVATSVPVAVPVVASDGSRLVECNGQLWQVEPWMPGTADFRDNPSRDRLDEAMTTLARFHRAAREFVPIDGAEEWFGSRDSVKSPAVAERIARLAGWERRWDDLNSAARQAVAGHAEWSKMIEEIDSLYCRGRAWVGDQLKMVETAVYRCQPCLRDIWHDHLLWSGDRITGLIDPGSSRIDNVAIDLARLLGSLVEDDATGWDQGLGIYQRETGLSLDETGLVTVLDQSGVLMAGAVWIERLAGRRVGTWTGESADHVRWRMQEVVRRMRTLVDRIAAG